MRLVASARLALTALEVNRVRSGLTALGVIIGVGAVVTMMAVGAGAEARVAEQIRSLGSNLIIVVSGTVTSGGARLGSGTQLTISEDDARAIEREVAAVRAAAPVVRGGAQLVVGNANWSTAVYGVTPGFFEAREWGTFTGRLLTREDVDAASKVVLLGQTVAQTLFGETDPTGQTIRVKKVPFTVIGVLERKGQSTRGEDQDDVILVPLSTAKTRLLGVSQANPRAVGSILVKVEASGAMGEAEQQIHALLRQRHRLQPGEDDDFTLRNLSEILESQEVASRVLSLLLAAIASVSLVVGGIGIMNIMLVSVTERTREIGLRRAVGARRRDILMQFLIEAVTVSLAGGFVGAAVGIAASYAIAYFAGWPALIQARAVVPAFLFAGAVGVFFGFYPARKASRLSPIDALRYE
ncbi:MAG: multidrug ABC transporter substrate-binding protein [Candidatus Rokubacteria bacterium RIFCSPHIGHO2_12_FULL_73_22]|nr:MAG: multidrug ABC transporter substrate-binding protein [Candidatus Rokubacteria bacterium RIFCSPHIGHO2_12_FULL_73_22]OGL15802.1 MAG: multidrug ABC transporter substrate-binding protein [Candidatus Rokubacteria bacterium RIFCSPLOWO2_12_FULL_71_22]